MSIICDVLSAKVDQTFNLGIIGTVNTCGSGRLKIMNNSFRDFGNSFLCSVVAILKKKSELSNRLSSVVGKFS